MEKIANFDKYLCFVAKRWNLNEIRPFIKKVLDILKIEWNNKNFFIIEAPTGYGKSTISATISLYSIFEDFKSIIVFPTRVLLEDQYKKFVSLFEKDSNSREVILVGKRYMHNPDSRYLIKPISLTTVDTLSLNLFGISPEDLENILYEKSYGHYFFSIFSTLFSTVILDEVHLLADSTKSLSFLIALMKIFDKFDQKLILMSATIPTPLIKKLEKYKDIYEKTRIIHFNEEDDPNFCLDRESKNYKIYIEEFSHSEKYEKILNIIKKEKERYSKILVIFNTVDEAIEFYKKIKNQEDIKNDTEILLLHSRFTEKDKEEKTEKISKIKKENKKYIIISTQVIEVGVDISSNLLITDIAPPNSLIQRFGRFLRYKGENEGAIYIWYEKENLESSNDYYKVYYKDLILRTKEWFEKNKKEINVHLPTSKNKKGYKELLNYVYSEEHFSIDEKIIENLKSTLFNIEKIPIEAIETLLNSGGSFLRDSSQIPVIPNRKENIELVNRAKEISQEYFTEFILNNLIAIPIEIFIKLFENKRVKGYYYFKNKNEILFKENIEFLKEIFGKGNLMKKLYKLYKKIIRKRIVGFLIEANYSKELGLEI